MEPKIVQLPAFQVVGYSISANLKEIEEQQLGKQTYQRLLSMKEAVPNKMGDEVYLVQLYPMKHDFNPMVDAFTQIIGFKVSAVEELTDGMISHTVPASEYVKYTHYGLESELGRTYDYLYGQWIPYSKRQITGYDFEIWDERYKPEQEENEIDVYVAVK